MLHSVNQASQIGNYLSLAIDQPRASAPTRNNQYLKTTANIPEVTTQNERFRLAGLGITAVYNYSGETTAIANVKAKASNICDNYPRNKQLKLTEDPAIVNRGRGLVASLLPSTGVDNTMYAQTLNIGERITQNDYDSLIVKQLANLWTVRDLLIACGAQNN